MIKIDLPTQDGLGLQVPSARQVISSDPVDETDPGLHLYVALPPYTTLVADSMIPFGMLGTAPQYFADGNK